MRRASQAEATGVLRIRNAASARLTEGGAANYSEPLARGNTIRIVVPRPGALWASTHPPWARSEEHTSELQSQSNLVCRLLLEKKKKRQNYYQDKIKSIKHLIEKKNSNSVHL